MKGNVLFTFDSGLMVGDRFFEVLEGPVQVSSDLLLRDPFFRDQMDYGFRFYGAYNIKTNDAQILCTHYPSGEETGKVVELPLNPDEKAELIGVMEEYCSKKYKVSCLELLNWQRKAIGLESLEAGMKNDLREKIAENVGYRMEEIYGIPLTDFAKNELVRFVQKNTYLLYADQAFFDDMLGRKLEELMKEQFQDHDGVIAHLCELLNKSEGWGSDRTVDEFDVIFESEHYVGVYFYNGSNEYYLVDKASGAYDLVLGDSPDFVGRYYLDKMEFETEIQVVNEALFGSLVEYSRENIAGFADFWTDDRIKGLLVLEKTLSALRHGNELEADLCSSPEKSLSAKDSGRRRLDHSITAAENFRVGNSDGFSRGSPKEKERE